MSKTQTLAQLRIKAGLSQKALAKKLGVAQSTVAGWELGTHKPVASRWKKLAKILGVKLDTITKLWT